jgi:hypothetical protein
MAETTAAFSTRRRRGSALWRRPLATWPPVRGRSAWPPPADGATAHTGNMGRTIWKILGAILAIWLAFMAIGWIVAMIKTFFIIGLIAVVVFTIVSLLAKRPRGG